MSMANPLAQVLTERLSAIDAGVMAHGFLPHGRDYAIVLEDCVGPDPGTYRLTFTHVVQLDYETRVRDESWKVSWGQEFTSYEDWQRPGEPDGYVWGTNWAGAYPGFEAPTQSENAREWSHRLGHDMFEMTLETDRFMLRLVFHEVIVDKLSNDASTVRRVTIPIE